jgi:hypothetical protein
MCQVGCTDLAARLPARYREGEHNQSGVGAQQWTAGGGSSPRGGHRGCCTGNGTSKAPQVTAAEAATQFTSDTAECRGCHSFNAKEKGKLQMLLPERTLAGNAKPQETAIEAAIKVMLKQQGTATEAATQEILPQETA